MKEKIEKDMHETTDTSAASLAKEGLCIMACDLAVQLSKSLAIYLALATDAATATAYQLAALDSYLPSYGVAWTLVWLGDSKFLELSSFQSRSTDTSSSW